jgi:hypothetical protein
MRFDFERALGETEDFLHRQLSSRAAREAQKRKVQRGINEVFRRVRRSALVMLLLLSALIAYSIFVGGIDILTWFIALPTVFLASVVALFWPSSRRQPRFEQREAAPQLAMLAGSTEEWLLERCRELPRAALPAIDTILARLAEMRPDLSALSPDTPVGGETRRLIGQHLPRLVDTYLALPPRSRDARSENSRRFTESLDIVAEELGRLSSEVHRDRTLDFETHRRFIETRYKDE